MRFSACCIILVVAGCDREEEAGGIPLLGGGTHLLDAVELSSIGTADADALAKPTDLAFHPDFPDELWVVNQADESVSIFWNVGTPDQESKHAKHATGEHFLARPAALAFGGNGLWASIHDHFEPTQGGLTDEWFMGPTLWTGDREIFDGGDLSHLDMLHNTPQGKGIAWSGPGNRYWVFDGNHDSITMYHFHDDHGLGGTDHRDGEVARFVEGEVKGVDNAPSHLEVDRDTDLLYIADSGNERIAILDTVGFERGDPIGPNFDLCEQYEVPEPTTSTLVDTSAIESMGTPVGLALRDGMVFVSSVEPNTIHAFDQETGALVDWLALDVEPNGIEFAEDGSLYFVSPKTDEVLRIRPLEEPAE